MKLRFKLLIVATASLLVGFTAYNAGDFVVTPGNGITLGGVRKTDWPSIVNSVSNITATASTNFAASFATASADFQIVKPPDSRAVITFSGIVVGRSVTLYVDALTNTVPIPMFFPANTLTNSGLVLTVTNGTARIYNLISLGGVDNTNVLVTGGDFYKR